jgi:predicted MPP superfamily phosphohydrolase
MPRLLKKYFRRLRFVAIMVLVILAGVLAYGVAEAYRIEFKEYTYSSPAVPTTFDGTRIVFLSDVHRGIFLSQGRLGRLVDRVNDLAPDLLLLGGDYVWGNTDYEASCFEELGRLRAPLGRFAVLGNHDYGRPQHADGRDEDDPTLAIAAIKSAGITLLDNRGVWLERNGGRIRLGGVSDYQEGEPQVDPTLEGTKEDDLVILLSHNPDFAEGLPEAVDLVLSGHTHGGQISFFGLYAFYLPSDYGQKYRTGVVENGPTTVMVSNGIGTSTLLPLRYFARPQILVITLDRPVGTD